MHAAISNPSIGSPLPPSPLPSPCPSPPFPSSRLSCSCCLSIALPSLPPLPHSLASAPSSHVPTRLFSSLSTSSYLPLYAQASFARHSVSCSLAHHQACTCALRVNAHGRTCDSNSITNTHQAWKPSFRVEILILVTILLQRHCLRNDVPTLSEINQQDADLAPAAAGELNQPECPPIDFVASAAHTPY